MAHSLAQIPEDGQLINQMSGAHGHWLPQAEAKKTHKRLHNSLQVLRLVHAMPKSRDTTRSSHSGRREQGLHAEVSPTRARPRHLKAEHETCHRDRHLTLGNFDYAGLRWQEEEGEDSGVTFDAGPQVPSSSD